MAAFRASVAVLPACIGEMISCSSVPVFGTGKRIGNGTSICDRIPFSAIADYFRALDIDDVISGTTFHMAILIVRSGA